MTGSGGIKPAPRGVRSMEQAPRGRDGQTFRAMGREKHLHAVLLRAIREVAAPQSRDRCHEVIPENTAECSGFALARDVHSFSDGGPVV